MTGTRRDPTREPVDESTSETTDDATEDETHEATINWDRFWADAEGDRRDSAHVGQYGKAALLERFFEAVGDPDSFASVGCGPAAVPLALAERTDADIYGFDAAPSAVEQARQRARERGVASETTVSVASLPGLDPGRKFDVVYCHATLHYVADVERALRALAGATAPGGHLVFNYPNRLSRARYDADLESDEARERFRLVLDGENLLSYDRIRSLLGSEPRSYWSAVDAPDEPWTGRQNPCVYARQYRADRLVAGRGRIRRSESVVADVEAVHALEVVVNGHDRDVVGHRGRGDEHVGTVDHLAAALEFRVNFGRDSGDVVGEGDRMNPRQPAAHLREVGG